jgi:DNA-binding MarR family transcriptional regulator
VPRAEGEQLVAWEATRLAVVRVEAEIERLLEKQRSQELSHYRVLATIQAAGGQMRMHELAEELVVGRSTATRICDRLQRLGLVLRERSKQDGRAVHVQITRLGREEFRRCQPAYERFVNEAFARYLDETDLWALNKIAEKLPHD